VHERERKGPQELKGRSTVQEQKFGQKLDYTVAMGDPEPLVLNHQR